MKDAPTLLDPRLDPHSMLNRWQRFYQPNDDATPIGEEVSYDMAVPFVDHPGLLEDWGCGLCWAKRFIHQAHYRGIDGTQTKFVDQVADLRLYRSDPQADFILMRHVLEHNRQWKRVLENAVASFKKKMVLVIFTPFSSRTREIAFYPELDVPDISFAKNDLTALFAGCNFREETWNTPTQYGSETLFFLEK